MFAAGSRVRLEKLQGGFTKVTSNKDSAFWKSLRDVLLEERIHQPRKG